MPSDTKLFERARDELFSHINRCGVLQAAEDDQRQWMDETIDYIGERYPDLSDSDLRDLYGVGLRFCKPVIRYGSVTEPAPGDRPSSPPLKVAAPRPAPTAEPEAEEIAEPADPVAEPVAQDVPEA